VLKGILGVCELSFAISLNADALGPLPLEPLENPHQQAGALQLEFL
jgi:hypothetical protein